MPHKVFVLYLKTLEIWFSAQGEIRELGVGSTSNSMGLLEIILQSGWLEDSNEVEANALSEGVCYKKLCHGGTFKKKEDVVIMVYNLHSEPSTLLQWANYSLPAYVAVKDNNFSEAFAKEGASMRLVLKLFFLHFNIVGLSW